MKHSKFLLPYGFKPVGYLLLALGVAGLVLYLCFNVSVTWADLCGEPRDHTIGVLLPSMDWEHRDLLFSFSGLVLVLGCLFAGFSRYREEDEYVEQLRYESLLLTFYLYVALLVGALCFIWDVNYLVFSVLAVFGVLVFYVVCLTLRVAIARKSLKHEE